MWKTQLNRAIREVRFVLKPAAEHHGAWRFASKHLEELRMLNQSTFFSVEQIPDALQTPSAVHFLYGDLDETEDYVETANLSDASLEKILKEKVSFGLTLNRDPVLSNDDRDLPVEIVEAGKYVQHIDDAY